MPLVRSVVGKLKASGLRPQIEASDLESQGYLALIQTIDAYTDASGIELTARLQRNVRTAVVRFIRKDIKHWYGGRIDWAAIFTDNGEPKL